MLERQPHDTPTDKPVPKLLGDRTKVIALKYRVEFDGKVYESITVSRMSTSQVADYVNAVAADPSTATLPMFDVPPQVLEALDADDDDDLSKVVNDFLPRRLRQAMSSPSDNGEATSASSQAS